MSKPWFPKFRSILNLRRQDSRGHPVVLPFQCSVEEVEHLKALRGHPAWKHYSALLERVAQAEYERLAGGLPFEQYQFQCGAFAASRRNFDLVDALITKLEEYAKRSERDADAARDNRDALFYGTDLWDTWQRERPAGNGAGS